MATGIKNDILIEYTGNAEAISVPSGVKEIGESAFLGCTQLKTAEISETVEKIGRMAFFKCEGLNRIDIPKNVSYIDETAFWRCENLEEIKVEKDNAKYCDIDGVLFSKDKKVLILYPCGKDADTYVVPKDVERIADRAFCFSQKLKRVVFQNNVIAIGDYAFEQCVNLENIKLPDSLKSMGEYIFDGCVKIKAIHIPKNVEYIKLGTFSACENLERITADEKNMFFCDIDGVLLSRDKRGIICYPCGRKDERYELPKDVKMITRFAFANNKYIKEVSLSDNTEKVEQNAFFGCNKKLKITYR